MSRFSRISSAALVAFAAAAGGAQAANITPYYLFDGDSSVGYEIANGVLVNTFSTFSLGYPVAIRSTIWLGHRDDAGATEYNLNGTPTGNTSAGGNSFGQLLDGATGPTHNYGVECCGSPNSVTVANADWSGQTVLFNIPDQGAGIAYDLSNNTLYVSDFSTLIRHYDLAGNLLDSFFIDQSLVGLAYEALTDTIWGFNTGSNNLVQLSKAGAVLQDVDIPDFNPGNPFGGEMANAAVSVPEPATLGILGFAMAALGFARRKRKA